MLVPHRPLDLSPPFVHDPDALGRRDAWLFCVARHVSFLRARACVSDAFFFSDGLVCSPLCVVLSCVSVSLGVRRDGRGLYERDGRRGRLHPCRVRNPALSFLRSTLSRVQLCLLSHALLAEVLPGAPLALSDVRLSVGAV